VRHLLITVVCYYSSKQLSADALAVIFQSAFLSFFSAVTYLRYLPICICLCLPITAYSSYCVYLGVCRFALIFLRAFLVCRFALNSARFSFLPKFITSYVWRFVILLRF